MKIVGLSAKQELLTTSQCGKQKEGELINNHCVALKNLCPAPCLHRSAHTSDQNREQLNLNTGKEFIIWL
jgi:hypothetical protein